MRIIDEAALDDITLGSTILGSGGGGDPYVGMLLARDAIRRFGPVSLVDIEEVPDDANVVFIAGIGAPGVLIEKLPRAAEYERVLDELERFTGVTYDYVCPIEAGGLNAVTPFATAAARNLPVIDADGMGRAFPHLEMVTPTLYGGSATPMVMIDEHGNTMFLESATNSWAEAYSRAAVLASGANAASALYPMSGRQAKEWLVRGALSMAQDIGRTIRETPALAATRLVLLTAFDEPDHRRKALGQGFSAYLTKPIRRSLLLSALVPAVDKEAQAKPEDVASPSPEALILVAEDNPTNRAVIAKQLKKLGFRHEIFADGRAALDAYDPDRHALVLTDCHMPVMDGFELTQKIRDLEHLTGRSRVPIVALTANVLQGEAERCLAAGMDDYLGKPVRLGRLAETIQRWLPKAAAATTAGEAHGEELGARALAANAPIDTAHLIEMFGEIDDVARATLATFLGSSRELVRAVIAQLATGDLASAGKSAHSIKGAARSAGAFPLAEIASGIEQAAKGEDMSEARQLSTGLAAELARVEAEVKRL